MRVLAFVLAALTSVAAAQPFPSKPLRLLVPFPPGGGTDAAPSTPEELDAWVSADIARYRRMIELTGARPEGR